MGLALLSRPGLGERKGTAPRPGAGGPPRFRPLVEGLEDRVNPAVLGLPLEVTDINIVGTGADRQLEAVVAFAGQATDTVTIDLATEEIVGDECPLLHLELGPIDLNLLGLGVETSEICLDVTATDDTGLLGGLLCDLSSGLDLGGVLDELGGAVSNFLDRLDSLLDDVLGRSLAVTEVFGQTAGGLSAAAHPHQADGVCDILNLSLGPVDLEVPLLGVNVHLDDCDDGPVTVDVTGDPEGGILGDLLCSLADGFDLGDIDLGGLIDRLDDLIDRLGDLADRLDDLGDLTAQAERLIDQLEGLIDRAENLAALDRVLDQIDRLIDRLL